MGATDCLLPLCFVCRLNVYAYCPSSLEQNNINAESGANGPVNQNATPPKHPADVLEALIAAVFLDCSCDMR